MSNLIQSFNCYHESKRGGCKQTHNTVGTIVLLFIQKLEGGSDFKGFNLACLYTYHVSSINFRTILSKVKDIVNNVYVHNFLSGSTGRRQLKEYSYGHVRKWEGHGVNPLSATKTKYRCLFSFKKKDLKHKSMYLEGFVL